MNAAHTKPSKSSEDGTPSAAPQTTPSVIGYGHPEYQFVQAVMEMQKSLGEINASIQSLRADVGGIKSKVDNLVAWKHMILGGAIVLGVAGSAVSFVIVELNRWRGGVEHRGSFRVFVSVIRLEAHCHEPLRSSILGRGGLPRFDQGDEDDYEIAAADARCHGAAWPGSAHTADVPGLRDCVGQLLPPLAGPPRYGGDPEVPAAFDRREEARLWQHQPGRVRVPILVRYRARAAEAGPGHPDGEGAQAIATGVVAGRGWAPLRRCSQPALPHRPDDHVRCRSAGNGSLRTAGGGHRKCPRPHVHQGAPGERRQGSLHFALAAVAELPALVLASSPATSLAVCQFER